MNKFALLILCFFSLSAMGQDLTGIWRGHFHSVGNRMIEQLLGEEDRYKLEIQLDQKSKQFNGVTYSYKTTVFYGKATCSGAVNTSTKKVILEELKIVELRMVAGSACIMTYFLQYSKSGDEEFLDGTYTSMNTTDSTNCGRGTVFLRKVPTSDFYKEPFLVNREKEKEKEKEKAIAKKPPVIPDNNNKPATTTKPSITTKKPVTTPSAPATTKPTSKPTANTAKKPVQKTTSPGQPVVKTPVPSTNNNTTVKVVPVDTVRKIEKKIAITPKVLLTRANELVKTIATDANEVIIDLYDNGTIDNDTVSVYLDKKLVVAKQRLTDKPITVRFTLDENNTFHELVMVAENLGEIPPNTSLMVVKAGSKQYEVRITSNEQKNAVVIFKYEKGG
ncbi:MAG TPA: hypothetical protein VKA49_13175 [Flavitalea sp.]|nr:hypothetical protein [Flavitalea sp.]